MSAFEDYCIVCEKLSQDGSAYCSDECKLRDQDHSTSPTLSVCSGLPSVHGSFSLHHSASNSSTPITTTSSVSANLINSASLSTTNNNNNYYNTASNPINLTVPTVISPLLTPQINPRCSVVSSVKSPTLKDLTYESPLLACSTNSLILSDLDSNRLDLNSSSSISERLSNSFSQVQNIHNKYNSQLHHPLQQPMSIKAQLAAPKLTRNRSSSLSAASINNANTNVNVNSNRENITPSNPTVTNVSNMLHSSSEKNYEKWLSIH